MFGGEQMIEVLNQCKIDAACLGNHELDFPEEHVMKLIDQCKFKWILSNVEHIKTQENLFHTITHKIF